MTARIKEMADIRPLGIEEVDTLLRRFHYEVNGENVTTVDKIVEGRIDEKIQIDT